MSLSLALPGSRVVTLSRAVDAAPHRIRLDEVGTVGYYASTGRRDAPPLVLLHGINVAASSAEMRPLFDVFRDRSVYALDWPGFGLSERGDRPYSPELYAEALALFVRAVASPDGKPVDVIALSLASEFAARAALAHPELIRSIVMISPTGLSRLGGPPDRLTQLVRGLGKSPRLAQLFYSAFTSRTSLRYFLNKFFHGPADPTLVSRAYESAHQPDARFAPLAFLRGDLFAKDAYDAFYRRLRVPSFVLYDRDPYSTFERLPQLTRENPFMRALRVEPSQGLPHFEQPQQVELAVRSFYDAIEAAEQVEARIDTVPLPQNFARASEARLR